MRHMQVTGQAKEMMLEALRAGAFLWTAAEVAGLPAEVVEEWVRAGLQERAREPYKAFAREVKQAAAVARVKAETAMLAKSPGQWLKYGPGKEAWGHVAWGRRDRAADEAKGGCADCAAVRAVVGALEQYPEAQQKARAALEQVRQQEEGTQEGATLAQVCDTFAQVSEAKMGGEADGQTATSDSGDRDCVGSEGAGGGSGGGEKRSAAGPDAVDEFLKGLIRTRPGALGDVSGVCCLGNGPRGGAAAGAVPRQ